MSIFTSLLHMVTGGGAGNVVAEADEVVSTVLGLMHDAESKFPSGAEKLEHVRAGLAAAWSKFDSLAVTFESAWPAISTAIGALVTFFNAAGVFKKAAAAH